MRLSFKHAGLTLLMILGGVGLVSGELWILETLKDHVGFTGALVVFSVGAGGALSVLVGFLWDRRLVIRRGRR